MCQIVKVKMHGLVMVQVSALHGGLVKLISRCSLSETHTCGNPFHWFRGEEEKAIRKNRTNKVWLNWMCLCETSNWVPKHK